MTNKSILITGGEGFVGSHVIETFVDNGYEVVAFSNKKGKLLDELGSEKLKHIKRITGDICDLDSVVKATKGCEGIIHLVALKTVEDSFEQKERYKKTNIGGTENVLEAGHINKVKKVIITSSSEVYGQPKELLIKEDHPLNGMSPYALTKIENEKSADRYRKKGLNVVVLRPTNIFGPRQINKAVIPTIITQMVRKNPELKIGLLSPTVDFNYAQDVALAYLNAYESNKTDNQTYNVSTGVATSIQEVADYVINKINKNAVIVCDKEKIRPVSDANKRIKCDASKLKEDTGWKPNHTIWEGLDLTIDYIEKNIDKFEGV